MNTYVEFKIKKKTLLILGIVLAFVCCMGVYYTWCTYNPEINIQIGEGGAGKKDTKIGTPYLTMSGRSRFGIAAAVEVKTLQLIMQHDYMCQYVRDNFNASDITLDMEVKDNKTILKYYGTATTLEGESVDFEKEVELDFVFNAEITKRE